LSTIFDWSEEKNERLRAERDVSFEEIVVAIEEGQLLDILEHPNTSRYEGQRLNVASIDNHAWVVPFVDRGDVRFLKTAFPSRPRRAAMTMDPDYSTSAKVRFRCRGGDHGASLVVRAIFHGREAALNIDEYLKA